MSGICKVVIRYELEVKSFRAPPEPVEFVMNAVCLLFNEEQE